MTKATNPGAARAATALADFERCARDGTEFLVYRDAHVETRADGTPAIEADARTVEVAFSSEEPVERFWGSEILDHGPGSCDLARLADGRAPVLVDHRSSDLVGVVVSAEIGDDRRGRAVLRFGKSARAEEIWQDVQDGIRAQVSVGYYVLRVVLEESGPDGDVYRATSWRPVEISLAAIAADPSVGVGRTLEPETISVAREAERLVVRGVEIMEPEIIETPAADQAAELARTRAEIGQREQVRAAEVMATAERWNCREEGLAAIARGTSAAEFRGWVLLNKVTEGKALAVPPTAIGLGGRELAQFSLHRAIKALASRDWSDAGLELEACREAEKRAGRQARGMLIPYEVLTARAPLQEGIATRAAVSKSGTSSATIETGLLAESFVDLLRNRMAVRAAGAIMLPGLVGNVAIPRRTGATSAAWVTEGNGSGDTAQTYDQVTLSPKTCRARSDMTRLMLLQSTPAIEQLTRDDIALVLALAMDLAALHGSGSGGAPTGIAQTNGIGTVAVGTNGGAPTWAHIVGLESEVALDNADIGRLAYVVNAKLRGKMKVVEKASATAQFLWSEGAMPVNGYPAFVTNQVSSTLTKGSASGICSGAFFGNWGDLLIGEWGTLDITAENVTLGDSGGVVVRGFLDVDIAVRHAESFSYCADFLTT